MPHSCNHIELDRQFAQLSTDTVAKATVEGWSAWSHPLWTTWPDILKQYRVVLLSSAGAGKTCEIRHQCAKLRKAGQSGFFIRLEELASGFSEIIFEDGDSVSFKDSVLTGEEIWIFLDSIDEARLDGPHRFERALKTLNQHIQKNLQNTHIILTSRVSAWRSTTDAFLVNKHFPYKTPKEINPSDSTQDLDADEYSCNLESKDSNAPPQSPIAYYTLQPLTSEQMQIYAKAKGTPDVETLISEITQKDLQGLADRPKDLDDLIAYWKEEERLENRSKLVAVNIERKLKECDLNRSARKDLMPEKAMAGAMKIAATVALTHQTKITVPDQNSNKDGFAVNEALKDWMQDECSILLQRPIFEPETYGFVRFDHRDSYEFLAARWFYELIQKGESRRVENLFFTTQYGRDIVVPRLRPILPWLALWDPSIRTRLLHNWPEILLEGGDPSSLPCTDRATLLKQYCAKHAETPQSSLSFDHATLRQLVSSELSDVVRSIYEHHHHHNDIEEFILHAIKLGPLQDLADLACAAAIKPGQDRYTRLAAMQAIVEVGDETQIQSVVDALAKDPALAKRHDLGLFIKVFGAKYLSCDLVMELVEQAGAGKRYDSDGLNQAVQGYIQNCSIEDVFSIILRISENLKQEPFIERRYCTVSKNNAWMLNFGIPACERLIAERNPQALCEPCLNIIALNEMARNYDDWNCSMDVNQQVPAWRELNTALFWYSVETARKHTPESHYQHAWLYRDLWRFSMDTIDEVIAWISDKECLDDKLVALNLALDIYYAANRPLKLRNRLLDVVKGHTDLSDVLHRRLNPPPMNDTEKRHQQEAKRFKKRHKEDEKAYAASREQWHDLVHTNLDQVRDHPPASEDRIWNVQTYLFECMRKHSYSNDKWSQINWESLSKEFGTDVAEAMRDGLMAIWRRFTPALVSETGKKGNSIPKIQAMGLSGLEIESRETPEWPASLTQDEACHAARYLFCELNGFPSWFRRFADHYPDITLNAVYREVTWELFDVNVTDTKPPHYVLDDLAWHAPWYAMQLAPHFLEPLRKRDPVFAHPLRIILSAIARSEDISDTEIAILCSKKIKAVDTPETHIPLWYASWVSVEPKPAIQHLTNALEIRSPEAATDLAIAFINALNNTHREDGMDVREQHKAPQHLLELYRLMNAHIRPEEDINRINSGVYSPTARDHAQRARDHLYVMLRDIPGKKTFDALMAIAQAAPNEQIKAWRTKQAIIRAEADADTSWQVCHVHEFETELERTPSTPRELFDLAVNRLHNLKQEYENGDFSPAEIIQQTKKETQLRTFLARELRNKSRGRYSISQEDEMPNQQRTDIRFILPNRPGMVPVELKIADNWSGSELLDKLRDQLCGDYLRDEHNKNGIFLLVFRGEKNNWQIQGKEKKNFEALVKDLQNYSCELLARDNEFKKTTIESIEVIGIDLPIRSKSHHKLRSSFQRST